MSGASRVVHRGAVPVSEAYHEEFNKLVDDVERLRAALGRIDGVLLETPNLAIGTVSKKEIKNDEFDVLIRGETVTVAAGETAFTATTHDIADPDAAPREAYYTLSVSAAGTITVTKGSDAVADAAVKVAGPADEVVIGYVKVQHDGSAIFDATTDDLDAAKLTTTFENAPVMAAANLTAGKINP